MLLQAAAFGVLLELPPVGPIACEAKADATAGADETIDGGDQQMLAFDGGEPADTNDLKWRRVRAEGARWKIIKIHT
jgi:hypothetical protein